MPKHILNFLVANVRRHRHKFHFDTDEEAYRSATELVDRFHPLRVAQLGGNAFHLRLYESNPNAPDQRIAKNKRRDSALLANLAMPFNDHSLRYEGEFTIDKAIEAVAAEMRHLADTGLRSREQELYEVLERLTGKAPQRPISDETLRQNVTMTPERRSKMFENGLEPATSKMNARRRKHTPVPAHTSPFVRGRKDWRAKQLLIACQHLRDLADWFATNPRSKLISIYQDRFDFAHLKISKSQFAHDDLPTRLAVAIASADHIGNGSDYCSNSALAISISKIYGKYQVAIRRSMKPQANGASISDIFKSLI